MKLKSLVCLSLIFLLSLYIFSCKKAKQEEEKETEIQKGALPSDFSITGTVTDKESKPLADVRIKVFAPPTDEHPDEETIIKETKTDSQGKFVIRGLKPDEYVIEAYKNGYFKHHEPISAPFGSLNIILHTGGIILGKVVDKVNNKPLKQYFIHILDTKEEPDAARVIRYDFDPEKELVESKDGSFWYARLASGTYKLIAYADGYAISILDNIPVEEGEKTSGITIELKKGATLTGIVRSEKSGAPIKEAEIYQILEIKEPGAEQPTEENIFIIKTDEKGEFKITGINAGEHILAINHDDFIPKQFEVGIYLEDTSQNIEIFLVAKSSSAK